MGDDAQGRLAKLFPLREPYARGRLQVSPLHTIYYEECGNPDGIPAAVLHGGPGGGISPFLRQLHDPSVYRIILFDQRGCGQSTPHAELRENTTWDLVADMERLRQHLGVARWHVLGGSWGSTLALAYALTHPEPVLSLILRGIFTIQEEEIRWFYQSGTSFLFPDAFEDFVAPIPEAERHDLVTAHYRRLTGSDPEARQRSARAWSQWEGTTLSLLPNPERVAAFGQDEFAAAFAGIECHYFVNKGFFAEDGWIIKNAHRLKSIPGVIIHGRYDVVTPLSTAWALHRAWPEARFEIVADAGHTAVEPGLTDALIRATNAFIPARDS
ncbi:MAG: prolyl aminopeptidase [Proteobacteria bacterium]|nr:prolyl aminopeptidase [Pseudomonadota bacterium]